MPSLPMYWIWTREGEAREHAVPEGMPPVAVIHMTRLWAARDTRWDNSIADVVDVTPDRVVRYAYACEQVRKAGG